MMKSCTRTMWRQTRPTEQVVLAQTSAMDRPWAQWHTAIESVGWLRQGNAFGCSSCFKKEI